MARHLATLTLALATPWLACGQTDPGSLPTTTAPRYQLMRQPGPALGARMPAPRSPWDDPDCTPGPVRGFFDLPGANAMGEGIAVSPDGMVYTADLSTNSVYRITPQGEGSLFATLCPGTPMDPENPWWFVEGAKGMGFSPSGDLWVCNPNPLSRDLSKHGLWTVDRQGQAALTVPLDPDACPFPNGLTFDPQGNLYFTESWVGGVWKVAPGERTATLWLASTLFTPSEGGWGANGIVYKDGALFVTNSDQVSLVKVPLLPDGSPGAPTVFASGFGWPDGIALGPGGTLYLLGGWSTYDVVRVLDDGSWETAVADVGASSSLAFGRPYRGSPTLFLANFQRSWTSLPSLLRVELCRPGARPSAP